MVESLRQPQDGDVPVLPVLPQFPDKLMHSPYVFMSILGEGGQGTVCQYKDSKTGIAYAVKFAPVNCSDFSILTESKILKEGNERNLDRLPRYITHDTHSSRRYMVMDILPESLDDHINSHPAGRERDIAIRDAGLQMVDGIEQLHNMGYLHRDIKSANFRVKDKRVFITDFGTSLEWMKMGSHVKEDKNGGFQGTLHFAHHLGHLRYNQGRRGDIESLGYVLLYLLTEGNYEWLTWVNNEKVILGVTQRKYHDAKKLFIEDEKIDSRLYGVQQLVRKALKIGFDEQPDYNEIRQIISNMFVVDDLFDTVSQLSLADCMSQAAQEAAQ